MQDMMNQNSLDIMYHRSTLLINCHRPLMMQLIEQDLTLSRRLLPLQKEIDDQENELVNHTFVLLDDDTHSNDWKDQHQPSCLKFHEISLLPSSRIVGAGCTMHAWEVEDGFDGGKVALKTIKALAPKKSKEFDEMTLETARKEAIISSELTFSPYIVDIYGYCGTSTIAEFSARSKKKRLRPKAFRKPILGSLELLETARDVAMGLYHLHFVSISESQHC